MYSNIGVILHIITATVGLDNEACAEHAGYHRDRLCEHGVPQVFCSSVKCVLALL